MEGTTSAPFALSSWIWGNYLKRSSFKWNDTVNLGTINDFSKSLRNRGSINILSAQNTFALSPFWQAELKREGGVGVGLNLGNLLRIRWYLLFPPLVIPDTKIAGTSILLLYAWFLHIGYIWPAHLIHSSFWYWDA